MAERGTTTTSSAGDWSSSHGDAEAWSLTIVEDPVNAGGGRRIPVLDELHVGRGHEPFGSRYRGLSREHAELSVIDGGLFVRDLGSHNGTFVNGRQVERARLEPGDIVGFGPVVLIAHRCPPIYGVNEHPRVIGASYAMAKLMNEVGALSKTSTSCLVYGEQGVGKSLIADEIHRAARENAPRVLLSCASTTIEAARATLDSCKHGGGTIILDAVDDAPSDLQVALLGSLRSTEPSPAWRVLATAMLSPAELAGDRLRPELAHYLGAWSLRVPPLRERPEDIPALVRSRLRTLDTARGKRIHPLAWVRIARNPWRGNVRELFVAVERAALLVPDDVLTDEAFVAPEAPAASSRLGFEVSRRGEWFRVDGASVVSLERRKTLRAAVECLVKAQVERPGEVLSVEALARTVWPGERLPPRAAANRVYVALTSLRRLGLQPFIQYVDNGYRLVAAGPVRISDD